MVLTVIPNCSILKTDTFSVPASLLITEIFSPGLALTTKGEFAGRNVPPGPVDVTVDGTHVAPDKITLGQGSNSGSRPARQAAGKSG
jgi:hypothetical protein